MTTLKGRFFFPRDHRILRRQDFFRVNQMGRKIHTPHFLVFMLQETAPVTRIGITVSRKVGNSVQRNRTKRLLREFFRLHYGLILQGSEISIIAKRGADKLKYPELARELGVLLRRPGER